MKRRTQCSRSELPVFATNNERRGLIDRPQSDRGRRRGIAGVIRDDVSRSRARDWLPLIEAQLGNLHDLCFTLQSG